jgi:DNA polymerase III delta prime subunit
MPREVPDFLRAYGQYVKESNAAEIFHLWVGIGVLSAVAQRKVFMRAAHYYIHSNMYILLVAPPGRGKKSTALRVGKELLSLVEPKINFAAQSGSFEGVVKVFTKIVNPAHQSLTLFSSELGMLMATNPAVMMDFLNDIYDGHPNWDRMTIKHDLQGITKPWLNLLGGTTPRWISDNAGLLASEGGFLARTILPYSEQRILDNPFPRRKDWIVELEGKLVNTLSHISSLQGQFDFEGGEEGEAFRWYDRWFRDKAVADNPRWKSRFPAVEDPRTAGYYDRKDIHLLKVAMALSLSYKDELVLTTSDLESALSLLDGTEPGMRIALRALGKNEWASQSLHLQRQIQKAGKMHVRDLLIENLNNMPKKKMDELLEELVFAGLIHYSNGYYIWGRKHAATAQTSGTELLNKEQPNAAESAKN